MKLKWKVDPPPTGQYKSFQKRGWPTGHDENDEAAAIMYHAESYTAQLAKDAGENAITVQVADWTNENNGRPDKNKASFTWRTLKQRFSNVKDAKAATEWFFQAHPEFLKK